MYSSCTSSLERLEPAREPPRPEPSTASRGPADRWTTSYSKSQEGEYRKRGGLWLLLRHVWIPHLAAWSTKRAETRSVVRYSSAQCVKPVLPLADRTAFEKRHKMMPICIYVYMYIYIYIYL